jgi:hypothetical protein
MSSGRTADFDDACEIFGRGCRTDPVLGGSIKSRGVPPRLDDVTRTYIKEISVPSAKSLANNRPSRIPTSLLLRFGRCRHSSLPFDLFQNIFRLCYSGVLIADRQIAKRIISFAFGEFASFKRCDLRPCIGLLLNPSEFQGRPGTFDLTASPTGGPLNCKGHFHETMAIAYRSSVRTFYCHASRRSKRGEGGSAQP